MSAAAFEIMALTALAFVLTAALIPVTAGIAKKTGFVDRPGGRKQHEGAIPPAGGLVVFPVFIILAAWVMPYGFGWLAAALILLVFTGALDDCYNIPARIKFAVQWIAALLVVIPGNTQTEDLGNLFGLGTLWMGWMAIPFSVIAVVLLINAINLMDGLDGLAGGTGFIVLFWLALCCALLQNTDDLLLLMIILGALAGFLVYNLRHPWRARASVFLGDSGSLALGLLLAWFCINLSQTPHPVTKPIAVAWLLALPIYDTCGQFARRVSQGRHPFDADTHHFHHHFLFAGLSPGQAAAAILTIIFLGGAVGVVGIWLGVPEVVLTAAWIAGLFLHIYMSMRPHRFRRILTRLRNGFSAENST